MRNKIEEQLKSKNQPPVSGRGACLVDLGIGVAYIAEFAYILSDLDNFGDNLPAQIFIGSLMLLQAVWFKNNSSLWGPNDGQ